MNLDTRALLARTDGIEVRPSSLAAGDVICDFCVLREHGCELEVHRERCGQFVPALSFASGIGLDGSFSTYRGSSIWYDRARVVWKTHRRLALVDTAGALIGFATIKDAFRSSFAQLMRDHAWTNHLVKNRGLTREEAEVWLIRWIKNNMGSRFVKRPEAIGTVIYLEREQTDQGAGEARHP